MGTGYVYKCKKCGNKYSFYVGTGMMNYEENLLNLDSKFGCILSFCENQEEKNSVSEMIKSGNCHLNDDYGFKILKCDKCGKYYDKFMYELYSMESRYCPDRRCPVCGLNLKIIDDNKVGREPLVDKCEKCGGTDFEELNMVWD